MNHAYNIWGDCFDETSHAILWQKQDEFVGP
jgi:hypothetical protein